MDVSKLPGNSYVERAFGCNVQCLSAERRSFLAYLSYWRQHELRIDLSVSGRHVGVSYFRQTVP